MAVNKEEPKVEAKQVDIQEISDLELAEMLSEQKDQLFLSQQNVIALNTELQRRKELVKK